MIGKIIRGNGFRGVLDYAIKKEKGRLIGGNMLNETPRLLAAEFGVSRELSPLTKKPVWHASISLVPGEELTDSEWLEVTKAYMKDLGFSDHHQYVAIKHEDTDHSHIHIVASKIAMDGGLRKDSMERRKSQKSLTKLEKRYGLKKAPRTKGKRTDASITERALSKRTKKPVKKYVIQETIEMVIQKSQEKITKPSEFKKRMAEFDIEVRYSRDPDAKIRGISFSYEGISYAGGKLGESYKWSEIAKRIVTQDTVRIEVTKKTEPFIDQAYKEVVPKLIDLKKKRIAAEQAEQDRLKSEKIKQEEAHNETRRLREMAEESYRMANRAREMARRTEDAGEKYRRATDRIRRATDLNRRIAQERTDINRRAIQKHRGLIERLGTRVRKSRFIRRLKRYYDEIIGMGKRRRF